MRQAGEHFSLQSALAQIENALSLLDATDAPGDIGAYHDLALCRLRSYVDGLGADGLVEPGRAAMNVT